MFKLKTNTRLIVALDVLMCLVTPIVGGCENLPGGREEQGAVIGGAAGAVLGAVIADENRLVGGLIGGLLGAGGGYLIGAKTDWFGNDDDDTENKLRQSVQRAQNNPATAAQARNASSADINNDGFVTLDEIVAMERAEFSDDDMIERLESTDQVFVLNADQKRILRDNGVSNRVMNRMEQINRQERDELLADARAPSGNPRSRDRDLDPQGDDAVVGRERRNEDRE